MICVGFLMIWLQKIYKKRENERNPTDIGIVAIYILTAEGYLKDIFTYNI